VNQPAGSADALSTDELREAFRLTPVERARLIMAARSLISGTDYRPEDLVSEAIVRALDGTRSCPRSVAPTTFLFNAMKSIASAAWEARSLRPRIVSMDEPEAGKVVEVVRDPSGSIEDRLVAREDTSRRVEALMELFKEDQDALCVVMGDLDDLEAEEIRGVCGLDEKAYHTVRRRIRRKIEREFPQGWQK
jgi:DNA-directed RNA polymerase specialized sigma24 family protein